MLIEPFRTEDIPGFLKLAAAERWLADPWELTFLQSAFPSGCFIARETESAPVAGYVTALRHERSGWIGNLIVRPGSRGNGIGETLFLYSLHALKSAGVETIWLTASNAGKSLYEKHGFSSIDTISRWSGIAGQRYDHYKPEASRDRIISSVSGMDCQAWGDRRDGLLEAVVGRGELLITESGFLIVQPCGASKQQFGPFSALDCSAGEQLLDSALQSVAQGTAVYLDVPNSNQGAQRILTEKGLHVSGSTELMFSGVKPNYRPELIYGLATMGSCG